MREFGGYLPIELNNNNEFYYGSNVTRYNSARSALISVIRNQGYKKIFIPVYMCESVRKALDANGIDYNYYNINIDLTPDIDVTSSDSAIMITNYFGLMKYGSDLVDKYKNVIFDNTQAFFAEPVENAFNIYSCRKFFGVCDGAYLVGTSYDEPDRYQPRHSGYLLDSITFSTNQGYRESLENEKQIENDGVKGMSVLSQKILINTDYGSVKKIRRENYSILEKNLSDINEYKGDYIYNNCVPMIYPLLIRDEDLRRKMVDHKIFVPQWWKYILDEDNANEIERDLSEFLLPLPIDQRYGGDDMCQLAATIRKLI